MGQRVQHPAVGDRGGATRGRRDQAGEHHRARELAGVALLVVHAHLLFAGHLVEVNTPAKQACGVQGLPLGQQPAAARPEHAGRPRRGAQPETADEEPAVAEHEGRSASWCAAIQSAARPAASIGRSAGLPGCVCTGNCRAVAEGYDTSVVPLGSDRVVVIGRRGGLPGVRQPGSPGRRPSMSSARSVSTGWRVMSLSEISRLSAMAILTAEIEVPPRSKKLSMSADLVAGYPEDGGPDGASRCSVGVPATRPPRRRGRVRRPRGERLLADLAVGGQGQAVAPVEGGRDHVVG